MPKMPMDFLGTIQLEGKKTKVYHVKAHPKDKKTWDKVRDWARKEEENIIILGGISAAGLTVGYAPQYAQLGLLGSMAGSGVGLGILQKYRERQSKKKKLEKVI